MSGATMAGVSVFVERNHLFLRNPRGGVEDVRAMQAAGFGAVFCNVGDHDPLEWSTIRARAGAAGVVCGPWLRTANADGGFDRERLAMLIETADLWESPLIVNSESELKGSAGELTAYINRELGARDAAISVEPWPFDNVEWFHLSGRPFLPQLFAAIVDYTAEALRDIWHRYGIECVVCTFGSYGGARGRQYERRTPYGVYTADDCGGAYGEWSPLGTVDPCIGARPQPPDGGDDMTPIGKQDGVTAACNRLRDLDPAGTLLVKTGDKWPSIDTLDVGLDKWKAYDKLERSLAILVADHDASG